jgi:hypothetical protein
VTESAEAIGRVVADLYAERVHTPPVRWRGHPDSAEEDRQFQAVARMLASDQDGPVVDASAIYRSLVDHPHPVHVYDDHPNIAPPWPTAIIAYRNEHGNVLAMSLVARDIPEEDRHPLWTPHVKLGPDGEVIDPEIDHGIDWSRVRWVAEVIVWVGGRSPNTGPVLTTGPMHLWRLAIYDDGQPADYRWVQLLPKYDMDQWDIAHLVVLGALNFMNCRNVELVEPARPRAEAKRVARTGVRVSTINVLPIGRSRTGARPGDPVGVPLTSVRGHFAHYGACCATHPPRGLLFGKLGGRYWIPQHARGTADLGEVHSDYKLRPQ